MFVAEKLSGVSRQHAAALWLVRVYHFLRTVNYSQQLTTA